MDYNQNNPLDRQENQQHFQEAPSPYIPPQTPKKMNAFTIASFICGICSVALCCVGILSIPLGALGILFAILSKQKNKSLESMSIAGLIFSIIGLVLGLLMSVFIIAVYLSDPDNRSSFGDEYRNGYWDSEYDDDYYDDHHYNDHYDDYYNDYYDDYYNDYYDYYRDYYRNYFDNGDDDFFFDDFYNYGFEDL